MFSNIETETINFQSKLEELKKITDDQTKSNQFRALIQSYQAKVPSQDTVELKIKTLLHLSNQIKESSQYKDLSILDRLTSDYYSCLNVIELILRSDSIESYSRDEFINIWIKQCDYDITIWSKRMRENIEVVRLSTNIKFE